MFYKDKKNLLFMYIRLNNLTTTQSIVAQCLVNSFNFCLDKLLSIFLFLFLYIVYYLLY